MSRVAAGRRLSVGIIDQALSSGSNFAAMVVAGRYLTRADFGAFALSIVLYTLALGLCRALCTEALLVRPGDDDRSRHRSATGAVGAAVMVGLASMVALLLAASQMGDPLRSCLITAAVCLPLLMLQDSLRHVFFARQTPVQALASDLGWVAGQVAGIATLIATDNVGATSLVAVWMGSGALAGLVHMFVSGVRPRLGAGRRWVVKNRDLSVPYALNFLTSQGSGHISSLVLASVAGLAATGSVRGAMAMFGPIVVVYSGAYLVIVPEGRRLVQTPDRLVKLCVATSGGIGVIVAALTIFLLAMPDRFGIAVLGSTWSGASSLIPFLGIAAVANAAISGAQIGLATMAEARAILRTRLLTVPTTLGLPVIGALVHGAEGLVIGLAAGTWINVGAYWRVLHKHVRIRIDEQAEAPHETTADRLPN